MRQGDNIIVHVLLMLCAIFHLNKVSDGALQTVLKVGNASGISLFGLWKQTGLLCYYTQYYRNDLIDRMNNTNVKNLDIYFRSQTAYFLIRYTAPFSGFSLESILSTKPTTIDDNGVNIAGSNYTVLIYTDGYEFALLNSDQTKIHAGIYYQAQEPLSPKFGFSSAGISNQKVHMYGLSVTDFSTQYTDQAGWTAAEILGVPDVYPYYGYVPRTWAAVCCSQQEFIQVAFMTPIYIEEVNIYETVNAGGVKRVSGRKPNGTWHIMWQTSMVTIIRNSRIFSPPFAKLSFPCNELKLEIDNSVANTWVEIDAIKISGTLLDITSDQTSSYLEIIADVYDDSSITANTTSLVTARLSDRLSLVCDVDVYSTITSVFWTKTIDGTSFDITDKREVVTINSTDLVLADIKWTDAGRYTCHVGTYFGNISGKPIDLDIFTGLPMCPCTVDHLKKLMFWESQILSNTTREELKIILEPILNELRHELKVNPRNVSASYRRLNCVSNKRASEKAIGYIGAIIFALVFGSIVIVDLVGRIAHN